MEEWKDGIMEKWVYNKNIRNKRRNKNRGYRKLEVWSKAIELYAMVSKEAYSLKGKPYRVINQLIGASYSVHANIAEWYCRRSLVEYLYFLNVAIGSLGELSSGIQACNEAGQLDNIKFDQLDKLHYEVENKLLKLIEALQKKQVEGDWEDKFFIKKNLINLFKKPIIPIFHYSMLLIIKIPKLLKFGS